MKIFSTVFIFALLSVTGFSQKPIKHPYNFKDFPVKSLYKGKTSKPIITKENRQFRTRIRESAKQKVNFAGKYILIRIGCGTSCEIFYFLDAVTGKVYSPNFSICCEFDYENPEKTRNLERIYYRIDSNLIVFAGSRNEENLRALHYYNFDNGKLKHLKSVKY